MQKSGRKDRFKVWVWILAVVNVIVAAGCGAMLYFGSSSAAFVSEITGTGELEMILPDESDGKTVNEIVINLSGSAAAESEMTPLENHRYEVICSRMTWAEAKAYCESRGGYLATAANQEEYNKILNLAASSGRKVLWLGGRRDANQNFAWITGEQFSYTSWMQNEPNNEGGAEDCLVMFLVNGRWVWADVPNDVSPYYGADMVGFVCEYNE